MRGGGACTPREVLLHGFEAEGIGGLLFFVSAGCFVVTEMTSVRALGVCCFLCQRVALS